jgi:hypothetical protein
MAPKAYVYATLGVVFAALILDFLASSASLAVKLFGKLITHHPSLITGYQNEQGIHIAGASSRGYR